MPFADYFAATWADDRRSSCDGSAGLGRVGDARRPARARAASCWRPRASRPRRSPRRGTCSSRGSPACCPGSAARSRTTGGSASSCATASRRTGRARATAPSTFGHFGRSGTFLWVDPDAGLALGCLTDLAFGDWAADAWPRLSDAVLAEVRRLAVIRTGTRAGARSAPRAGRRPTRWPAPGTIARSAFGISSARCCGDRVEVGLVVLADDHERRHLQRRERRELRPEHLRLLVRSLQLERAALLRPHLVAVLRARPRTRGSPAVAASRSPASIAASSAAK